MQKRIQRDSPEQRLLRPGARDKQVVLNETESDQRVFVFSLKEEQKIQVQGRLRGGILFSVEKRRACSLCCGAQKRAGTLSSHSWSDQAPRLWGSEKRGGTRDDGAAPFSLRTGDRGLPPFLPTASPSPSPLLPPGLQMCTVMQLVLAPSLPPAPRREGPSVLLTAPQRAARVCQARESSLHTLPASFPPCLKLASAPVYSVAYTVLQTCCSQSGLRLASFFYHRLPPPS